MLTSTIPDLLRRCRMNWNILSGRIVNELLKKISYIAGESYTGHGTGSVMDLSVSFFIFSLSISNRETTEASMGVWGYGSMGVNFTTGNSQQSTVNVSKDSPQIKLNSLTVPAGESSALHYQTIGIRILQIIM